MALVCNPDVGPPVGLVDGNLDMPLLYCGLAMPYRIFHDRLENQRRQIEHRKRVGQLPHDMDCSLKTGFGNVQVVPHIGQLLLQGDKRLVDREGLPEIAGQRQDRLLSPLWAGTAQSGDGAQGVEEEMRVDLRLQGPQLDTFWVAPV